MLLFELGSSADRHPGESAETNKLQCYCLDLIGKSSNYTS